MGIIWSNEPWRPYIRLYPFLVPSDKKDFDNMEKQDSALASLTSLSLLATNTVKPVDGYQSVFRFQSIGSHMRQLYLSVIQGEASFAPPRLFSRCLGFLLPITGKRHQLQFRVSCYVSMTPTFSHTLAWSSIINCKCNISCRCNISSLLMLM